MLGIYMSSVAWSSDLIKIKEKFSSVTFTAFEIPVCLVYSKYRDSNAFYRCDSGWLLFDGAIFLNNIQLNAETLFEIISKDGTGIVSQLNGEFLIASYVNEELIFVTDRMGQRQHCIVQTRDGFSIAPTPGMALKLSGKEKIINKPAMYYFISSKKIRLNRDTIWEGCELLQNACHYTLKPNKRLFVKKYWELEFRSSTREDYQDKLSEIYKNAVNIRTGNKLKKGLTLTGGLDSRTMICAINEGNLADLTAVTSGMSGCTEVEYASQVAKSLNIRHEPYELNPDAIFSSDSLSYFEEEDIDLLIQGQWRLFSEPMKYDYLLHGLDLDVTIGGIYLTDKLFEVETKKELIDYIYNEAFLDLSESKDLFTHSAFKRFNNIIDTTVESILDRCPQKNLQEQYDYFILMHSMNRVILQRYRAIRAEIDTVSPMYDIDLINYYLTIPIEERRNYTLFHPFMMSVCGDTAKIPYQRTNLPAETPVSFWSDSQKLEKKREELYRRVAKDTNGDIFIHYNGYYTNVDEWLRFNSTWRSAVFELLQSDDSVIIKDWVNKDYVTKLISDHQNHEKNNMSILVRLMSAEIFLRIEKKESLENLAIKINKGRC